MPTTKPLDMSRNVRRRACTFSKTRSLQASLGTRDRAARNDSTLRVRAIDSERVMAHFPESLESQLAEVDCFRGMPRCSHECQGVGAGARGRAEAGHCEAMDRPAVDAEHVAGGDGDQGCERGIEAARNADVELECRAGGIRCVWPAPRTGCRRSRHSGR